MAVHGAFTIEALTRAAIPKAWVNPSTGPRVLPGEPTIGGWNVTIPRAGLYNIWIDGLYGVSAAEFIVLHNGTERGCAVRAPCRDGEGGKWVLFTRLHCRVGDRIALDDGVDEDDTDRDMSMPRMVAVPLRYEDVAE
jgi:hypothetical protein